MSETKHTPGPWVSGGCVVYGGDGDSVADLSLNGRRHPDVTEANTRLCAAAPELLEACVAAYSALGFPINDESMNRVTNQLADAIAKAKRGAAK